MQYTIKDILGSDNIKASRSVITANFKVLVDGINKIETFLNTTSSGAVLNVADVLIKKYSNSINTNIFRCEASGSFTGNITVAVDATIQGNASIGNTLTIAKILQISRSKDNTNKTNISTIASALQVSDLLLLSGKLSQSVDTSEIDVLGFTVSGEGKNILNLVWADTTGSSEVATIGNGYDGQVLIVTNSGSLLSDTFTIEDALLNTIVEYTSVVSDLLLSKIVCTLLFVATDVNIDPTVGTWKIINSIVPSGVTQTI
jgi:hypothetical protein